MANPKKKPALVAARFGRTSKPLPPAYATRITRLHARMQAQASKLAPAPEDVAGLALAVGVSVLEGLALVRDILGAEMTPEMQKKIDAITYAKLIRWWQEPLATTPELHGILKSAAPQVMLLLDERSKTGKKVNLHLHLEDMKPDLKLVPTPEAPAGT